MSGIFPLNIWYIISVLLAPVGFIFQDVVADAMTVEAVPAYRTDGTPLPENELRRMHVTIQTLGRVAILGGNAAVAGLGGWLAQTLSYAAMYWISLIIPVISVGGVVLGGWLQHHRNKQMRQKGISEDEIKKMSRPSNSTLKPDYFILGGSGVFVCMALMIGLSNLLLKKEIIFCGSLLIVAYLNFDFHSTNLIASPDIKYNRLSDCIIVQNSDKFINILYFLVAGRHDNIAQNAIAIVDDLAIPPVGSLLSKALITPVVNVRANTNGLPTAKTAWPTEKSVDVPTGIGRTLSGVLRSRITCIQSQRSELSLMRVGILP